MKTDVHVAVNQNKIIISLSVHATCFNRTRDKTTEDCCGLGQHVYLSNMIYQNGINFTKKSRDIKLTNNVPLL